MRLTERMGFVFRLPVQEKKWLVVCLLGSFLAPFAIKLLSSRQLVRFMGSYAQNRQLCIPVTEDQILSAEQISRQMRRVSRAVPWQLNCLPEALCVRWLLKRQGIPCVFYLGARLSARQPDKRGDGDKFDQEVSNGLKKLDAHAWICVGGTAVIGGDIEHSYEPVATFTTPQCL